MSTPFPTQLSEIYLNDTTTAPTLYGTLKYLKKTTLSLRNRFRSILADARYVAEVVHLLFPDFPLIANERCGSWYIPPDLKGGSAYFKSTDGHHGAWDFSLRRLNLSVLAALGERGGAVVVDSTRRGKRMPDALRRTVPVWTVVVNQALFGDNDDSDEYSCEEQTSHHHHERGPRETKIKTKTENESVSSEKRKRDSWAFRLQHPGLDAGEVSLIEAKVPGWVAKFRNLGLDLSSLKRQLAYKPIRLAWIVQGERDENEEENSFSSWLNDDDDNDDGDNNNVVDRIPKSRDYNLLVLCSASRRVQGATEMAGGDGWYVQGAADDAEGWSGGLTSDLFWKHHQTFTAAAMPEEAADLDLNLDLGEVVARVVEEEKKLKLKKTMADVVRIKPTGDIFVAASAAAAAIASTDTADTTSSSSAAAAAAVTSSPFGLIINCHHRNPDTTAVAGGDLSSSSPQHTAAAPAAITPAASTAAATAVVLNLDCRPHKLGSRDLRDKLSGVVEQVSKKFSHKSNDDDHENNKPKNNSNSSSDGNGNSDSNKILITCETGRDLSIGVALTLLCLFYDDKGQRITPTLTPTTTSPSQSGQHSHSSDINKQLVKKRLAWITVSKPDANPSRSTLQAVNSFLMGQSPLDHH